ncbi:NAD(P)H-binding protein [Blastococcus sp. SYSU D00669]
MKVLVFGGSGLIGDGIVKECLEAADVTEVLAVGRRPLELRHPKLRTVVHGDFLDFAPIADELAGADACVWALGVSSVGMDPAEYERVTYGYTAAAARTLAAVSPAVTFVYVSGAGTDSSERGRSRWARVKGRTENLVLGTFPDGYALRPGFVRSVHGGRSRTALYRWGSSALTPIAPLLQRRLPALVTSTADIGRTALRLARHGAPEHVLENRDIVATAAAGG